MSKNQIYPGVRPDNQTETCFTIPPKVHSNGVLEGKKSPINFLTYSLPLLELQMGIILMSAHGFYLLLKPFGFTMFICHVLTGIILGSTFMGRWNLMREVIFPKDSQEIISEAALFGFIIWIFINGVKMDIESAKRSTGKFAIITGVVSVIVPLSIGLALLRPLLSYLNQKNKFTEAKSLMIMSCFSTFSVVVHVLEELKLMTSEIGILILPSAWIACGVSVLIIAAYSISLSGRVLIDLGAYIAFMVVFVFLIKPLILWMIRRIPQGSPMYSSSTYLVAVMALLTEAYFRKFHQLPSIGPFTFGILIPAGPPLGSALVDMFETFCSSVLMPLAVVITVMKADLSLVIFQFGEIKYFLLIIVLIGALKLVSCAVALWYWQIPPIDSVLFAIITASKGSVELTLYMFACDLMLISEPLFALLVLYVLFNSAAVIMTVKLLNDPVKKHGGNQERNIMSLKPDSQLRILACVHKSDNANSITRLIESFHPSKDSFIVLHVLHLVELNSLNSPFIISHEKQKPVTDSPSKDIIISFNQYEQNNQEGVSISTYCTAIAPIRCMIEDIRILAHDHSVSLILLPFHRKWSIHGKIESEDCSVRTINCEVLEKAPCSVGIFFDRGKLGRRSSILSPRPPLSVCVIFLGGSDDRETLYLAKRIAQDNSSRLTIIHLVLNKVETFDDEDSSALEEFKKDSGMCLTNVEYQKQIVKDGADTAAVIRSIADEYDLFVLGRRYGIESAYTSGLSEWTELPELGIIGDMFSSDHTRTRAAVLIVQQQRKLEVAKT